jgi:hypothetical protein
MILMATKTTIKKFASLRDAYDRAKAGDEAAQRCIIGCLSNLGCDNTLANQGHNLKYGASKWVRHYRGLDEYISALVGEYGMTETKAEKEVLAELNSARTYSDDIKLTDEFVILMRPGHYLAGINEVSGQPMAQATEDIKEAAAYPTYKEAAAVINEWCNAGVGMPATSSVKLRS